MKQATWLCVFAAAVLTAGAGVGEGYPHGVCGDWVIVNPDITCTDVFPPPCDRDTNFMCRDIGFAAADSIGGVFQDGYDMNHMVSCTMGTTLWEIPRYEVRLFAPDGSSELIAYLHGVCVGQGHRVDGLSGFFIFTAANGRLYVNLRTSCVDSDGWCEGNTGYNYSLLAFDGFPTTFELGQTYVPDTGSGASWGFSVPEHPEGLDGADNFDTYYGDLSTVGNWSQAQGLQCSYPIEIPNPGDYLTVADSLSDPHPGEGRYYVTAVTYLGETRYGRKTVGGVTSGRDPAALPGCSD